jgi:hypothetical protein
LVKSIHGTGNFLATAKKIFLAFFKGIKLNSTKVCPALTREAQKLTAPLPLPIRISFGFLLTGISGIMRNQNVSDLRKCLEICRRVVSSCFKVNLKLLST